jgi:hypothetical protein
MLNYRTLDIYESKHERISKAQLELLANSLQNPVTTLFFDPGALWGRIRVNEGGTIKNFESHLKVYEYLFDRLNKEARTKDAEEPVGLGSIDYQGLLVIVENDVGSIREGVDKDGNKWQTIFLYPYGYLDGTKGADGEGIDCFVGPNPYSMMVYIIHQNDQGKFDEDKCMLGFDSLREARDAYLAHYDTQMKFGPVSVTTITEFKQMIAKHIAGQLTPEE